MLGHFYDEGAFWPKIRASFVATDDPNFRAAGGYWSGRTWLNYVAYILRGQSHKVTDKQKKDK